MKNHQSKLLIVVFILLCLVLLLASGYVAYTKYTTMPTNRASKLPPLPPDYKSAVMAALEKSGENRNELVKALAGVETTRLSAMCHLVSRLPQYDLVNIKAEMLLDSVNSAFNTNSRVPWRISTDSIVFLDYVLPYRVNNESLENSRVAIRDSVMPLVRDCRTVSEAVSRVISFSLAASPPNEIHVGSAYPYDYSPLASLKYGRLVDGLGCRGQSIFVVAALRAIGVPACHLDPPTTITSVSDHSNILYFDRNDMRWYPRSMDDDAEGSDVGFVGWQHQFGEVTVYAVPPNVSKDLIGKQLYDELTNIGTYKYPSGLLRVTVTDKRHRVSDASICVYIWCDHMNNWYPALLYKTNAKGMAEIVLGDNQRLRPYMVSASKGSKITYTFAYVKAGYHVGLTLDLASMPGGRILDVKAAQKMGEP